ncbi:RNA-binding domain-containing protein [Saccharicrinis sp. GN24d3]|uniref:RNA-binding domain-containing protein n=1 Tax=Saccharicrinis sp. GN24d3 TaxID=3458416 RepID=UPI004036C9B1
MTKEELIYRLSDLEWEDFEVKEAKANVPKGCWETVSSFSNTNGGWLVFGIRQKGKSFEVTGIDNAEKIEQDFLNTLRGDKFNVPIPTRQYKYTLDGKNVLAFYIPVSNKKPVYYNTQANTFIRRGSGDQRATKEEVDAMYRDQSFGTKTSECALGTSVADLHVKSLKQYRDYMTRFNPDVSYNRFDQEEFLNKLRIIENGQCTYGGLLFMGKREVIEKHFPDFRIDLLEVPGTSYQDAQVRYTFRLDEFENLWEYYFECFARLKPKVDVEFKLTDQGFGQELSPGLQSIREALVNMLMHADYFSPAHARIRIFTNHIEFYNPGGLPKPLEELKGKDISLPRNPIISKLFRMVKMAENAGFGFDKIETNWESYNKTSPEYDLAFDSTIVKLFLLNKEAEGEKPGFGIGSDKNLIGFGEGSEKVRIKWGDTWEKIQQQLGENLGENLGETLAKVFFEIQKDSNVTAAKLSQIIGKSTTTIENNIKKLKELGVLRRIGPDKGGHWQIISPSNKE